MSDAKVEIFTDGACSGNPGPGGWGAILRFNGQEKELSGGASETTNNRMELLAAIVGIEAIKKPGLEIMIYSDSKYVVDSVMKGWIWGWQKKGFAKKKNPDLWRRFIPLFKKHKVSFKWVKGHAGIPENERCDQLATEAADASDLEIDTFFEKEEQNLG